MVVARTVLGATLLVLALPIHLDAQEPATPPGCHGPHAGDFDFWVGEWSVYAPDGGALQGHNSITKKHGGCLIAEHWVSAKGSTGDSMNFYDPLTGAWRQVWISPGVFIDYAGGLDAAGAMVLEGEIYYDRTGQRAPFRGTWTPLQDGRVRQHFEQQGPDGNWSDWFIGIYVRKDEDPRDE